MARRWTLSGGDTINDGQLSINDGQINVAAPAIKGKGGHVVCDRRRTRATSPTFSTLTVGEASSGTLTLSDDLVTNATGVITVANNALDLTGGTDQPTATGNSNGGQIEAVSDAGDPRERNRRGHGQRRQEQLRRHRHADGWRGVVCHPDAVNGLVTIANGVTTIANDGNLALTGVDTINDGQLNNNGGQINVTGADTIENETGLVTIGAGKNSFTNTGTLTVGGASSGTLTLSDDLVTNATGVITVANDGTLDLTGGDTINAGNGSTTMAARSMSPAPTRSRTQRCWSRDRLAGKAT